MNKAELKPAYTSESVKGRADAKQLQNSVQNEHLNPRGYFVIEKDIPRKQHWNLPEWIKNLIQTLEVEESFSFPITYYLTIRRYVEKRQNQIEWGKKFSLRKLSDEHARIWRIK